MKAGPFDGWIKINVLSQCNLGFSIFLAVVQNLLYYVAIGLGIFCLVKSGQVRLLFYVNCNNYRSMEKVPSLTMQCLTKLLRTKTLLAGDTTLSDQEATKSERNVCSY